MSPLIAGFILLTSNLFSNLSLLTLSGYTTIFADGPPSDMITGGAGWLGAGLLGLVLFWLLVIRMPAWDKLLETKDKQIQALVDSRDTLFRAVAEEHDKAFVIAEKDRRIDFQESLKTIVDHCQREVDVLRQSVEKSQAENAAVMVDLRKTIEELRESLFEPRRSTNPTTPLTGRRS